MLIEQNLSGHGKGDETTVCNPPLLKQHCQAPRHWGQLLVPESTSAIELCAVADTVARERERSPSFAPTVLPRIQFGGQGRMVLELLWQFRVAAPQAPAFRPNGALVAETMAPQLRL